MVSISPTLAGFRAAFRRPSLTFAEIAWRWSLGAAAAGLLAFAFFEYLDSLSVTGSDALLLRSRQPFLAGQAIAHILGGSLQRLTFSAVVGATGLAGLWIVAASLGRVATVRGLLDYFETTFESDMAGVATGTSGASQGREPDRRFETGTRPLRSLLGLNFLRAAVVLASLAGFQGAAILAGFASPEAHPQPGLAFLLFLPLAGTICVAWWGLNWVLSLAAVFAVRDGDDVLGALSAAVTLCRERTGAVFAVSTWTGLAHLSVFLIANAASWIPLGFIHVAPLRLVIAGVVFLILAYLAVADWLYMARLAGYVCIAEMPDALLLPPPQVLPAHSRPGGELAPEGPNQTAVDREEPILSDVSFALVLYTGHPI